MSLYITCTTDRPFINNSNYTNPQALYSHYTVLDVTVIEYHLYQSILADHIVLEAKEVDEEKLQGWEGFRTGGVWQRGCVPGEMMCPRRDAGVLAWRL